LLISLSYKHLRGLKDNKHKLERATHIVGNNGSGKTSVLEATSLLLNGKSFLSTNKKELIRSNNENLFIKGVTKGGNSQTKKLSFSLEKTKVTHKAENKKLSQQKAHLEHPLCVIDSNVVNVSSGLPSYRRGMIDRAVFHVEPEHAKNHKELKRCILQRNRALVAGGTEQEVTAWNEPLALVGEKVSKAREGLLIEAKPYFKDLTMTLLGPGYSFRFIRGWKSESYLESLLVNEKKDRALKNTSVGPQREDIKLLCLDKNTKRYSSHGEEKLASIAFVFSLNVAIEKRKNKLTTMLFDELESGLDNSALIKLIEIIKSLKNQLLITSLRHQSISKKISGKILYPEQK
jgi:DNA replication and repair protein RecF